MRSALLALVLLVIAVPSVSAQAQRVLPADREQMQLSFAPVVKRTTPAVVNVFSRRVVRGGSSSPLMDDPLFRRFFGENSPFGMPTERVQSSLGSGVLVGADGMIVTNHHVVKDATEITIVLSDRREFEAQILRSDERTDLAVLKIDPRGEKLPFLELRDSDELEVGDLVLAIGNPFGVGQTVTSGIVSALARTHVGVSDFRFFIQTDAAINPGNSGGALVSLDGRLVGINTAIYSRSGGSIGIGFAIPTAMVRTVLTGSGAGGRVVRPWFGAAGQPISGEIAASLGLKRPVGVILKDISPASPAAQAGLRIGDAVLSLNGHEVEDPEALRFRIATQAVGDTAKLSVWRNGSLREVTLTLTAPPENPPREITDLRGNWPLAGAKVANLSPALADELGLETTARGVIVLAVPRGSPAARVGINAGDIVTSVNTRTTETVGQLIQALPNSKAPWNIGLKRNDRQLRLQVGG